MSNKQRVNAKKKSVGASVTSSSIDEQIKDFLAKGGQIETVATGVSGQVFTGGRKQICLGNSPQK